jgi:uncharacterized phage infection (PIP) family protein YhgE
MKYCKLKILAFYTSLQLLLSFGLKGSIKGQDIKGKDNLKSLLCCGDYVGRKELEEKDEKIKDLETKIQTLIQYYEKNINSFKEKNEKLAKELAKKDKIISKILQPKPKILPPVKNKFFSFFK